MILQSVRAAGRMTCGATILVTAAATTTNVTATAQIQEAAYPTRPIRVIVGFQPGGGSDLLARLVSPKLTERLGQSVVVDNRSGAGGGIAMETAANSTPDGYTLLVVSGSQVTNISLFTKLKVDVTQAFAPISQMTAEAYVLLARDGFQPASITELIAAATAKPGTITCGSSGTGSFAHLGIELFNSMANVKILHVPYKGSGQALIDLLGGQIDMTIASSISAAPHMKTGKARALAVTSAKRTPLFPDIPTIAESGVPGYDVESWYGLVAPRATPEALIKRLNGEIGQILAMADVKANLARSGAIPVPGTPEAFAERIAGEIAKWRKVVAETGLRLE